MVEWQREPHENAHDDDDDPHELLGRQADAEVAAGRWAVIEEGDDRGGDCDIVGHRKGMRRQWKPRVGPSLR